MEKPITSLSSGTESEDRRRTVPDTPAQQGDGESMEAFTTRAFQHDGRKEILVVGGDAISGKSRERQGALALGHRNPRIGHWLGSFAVAGDGVIWLCPQT